VLLHLSRALVVTALGGLVAGCATLGDDAGIRVAGDATALEVTWTTAHPWAQQLGRQASQWHLYAQYRNGQQLFEQDLGAAQSRLGEGWRFPLPDVLKRLPEASVCLFIGEMHTGSGLPVRLQTAAGYDTARFRNPAWEARVIDHTRSTERQHQAEALEASARQLADALASARKALHQRGIDSAADCARAPGESQDATAFPARPDDVTPPEQQAATAHRMCVRRARNIRRRLLKSGAPLLDMAEFISQARSQGRFAPGDRLTPLADGFLRDWDIWHEHTGADYVPELGAEDALLPMGEVLLDRLGSWIEAGRHADPAVERQLAGGLLDAYAACVEDVGKQLTVSYEEWQRARIARPLRAQAYAERERTACIGELKHIDDLETAVRAAEDRAHQAKETPGQVAAVPPAPLAGARIGLNEQTCAP
jgi:hypothetical protein